MDLQQMFNVVAGVLGGLMGWLLNTMWNAVRSLETKIAAIDVLVAGQYVPKKDFEKMTDTMFAKLDKIHEIVERKADKI
jgi:hypothetical protein